MSSIITGRGENATPDVTPSPSRLGLVLVAALFSDLLMPRPSAADPPATPDPVPQRGDAASALADQSLSRLLAPPTPERALAVYALVQGWVRAQSVSDAAPAIDDFPACAVTLRDGGEIVGRGLDVGGGGGSGGGVGAAARAVRAALADFDARHPRANDTLADAARRADAERLTVSLELAGPLIPLDLKTFADAAALSPGLDGVLVRFGATEGASGSGGGVVGRGGKAAAVFPQAMMLAGSTPPDALRSAIAQASGDPTLAVPGNPRGEPPALTKDKAAAFYRFRTTHVVGVAPDAAPTILFRGSRLVRDTDLTAGSLRGLAERLARRLADSAADPDAPNVLAAAYLPARDAADGAAQGGDQLLAAFAIARYASVLPTDDRRRADLLAAARRVYDKAASSGETDTVAAAAAVVAGYELGIDGSTLIGAKRLLARAYEADRGWNDAAPAPARGLVALALAVAAVDGHDPDRALADRVRAEAAVRSLFRDTPPADQVTHLPWLGWAAQMLAAPGQPVSSAAGVRELRDLVWSHQVSAEVAGDEPDLAGGIVFTGGVAPLPTAQTARPVAFLAGAIADARLTDPDERVRELSRTLSALRFLRQLTVDEWSATAARRPSRAIWGVRCAPWDQRQTIDAQTMTLLAVTQTLRTIDAPPRP